jgi:hypothetical protein
MMMRPKALSRRFLSKLFSSFSDRSSSYKVARYVSCLALIYCLLMTLCLVPGANWAAFASSKNAASNTVPPSQSIPNAAPPQITNLPNIDETRYERQKSKGEPENQKAKVELNDKNASAFGFELDQLFAPVLTKLFDSTCACGKKACGISQSLI